MLKGRLVVVVLVVVEVVAKLLFCCSSQAPSLNSQRVLFIFVDGLYVCFLECPTGHPPSIKQCLNVSFLVLVQFFPADSVFVLFFLIF